MLMTSCFGGSTPILGRKRITLLQPETQTEPIPTDSRLRTTVSRAQGSPERAVLSNLVSGTPMDSPDRAMPSNLFSGSPTDVDTTRHDTPADESDPGQP